MTTARLGRPTAAHSWYLGRAESGSFAFLWISCLVIVSGRAESGSFASEPWGSRLRGRSPKVAPPPCRWASNLAMSRRPRRGVPGAESRKPARQVALPAALQFCEISPGHAVWFCSSLATRYLPLINRSHHSPLVTRHSSLATGHSTLFTFSNLGRPTW